MASIFSAIGSVFGVVTDSSEAMSSAIKNFREEQRLDHTLERIGRQSRLIKEARKVYKETAKELNGITDTELSELNKLNEELGYSLLNKPTA